MMNGLNGIRHRDSLVHYYYTVDGEDNLRTVS